MPREANIGSRRVMCRLRATSFAASASEGRPVWLEINTLLGQSHTGNLATMAAAVGIEYDQLIRTILATAHTTEGYRP